MIDKEEGFCFRSYSYNPQDITKHVLFVEANEEPGLISREFTNGAGNCRPNHAFRENLNQESCLSKQTSEGTSSIGSMGFRTLVDMSYSSVLVAEKKFVYKVESKSSWSKEAVLPETGPGRGNVALRDPILGEVNRDLRRVRD